LEGERSFHAASSRDKARTLTNRRQVCYDGGIRSIHKSRVRVFGGFYDGYAQFEQLLLFCDTRNARVDFHGEERDHRQCPARPGQMCSQSPFYSIFDKGPGPTLALDPAQSAFAYLHHASSVGRTQGCHSRKPRHARLQHWIVAQVSYGISMHRQRWGFPLKLVTPGAHNLHEAQPI
jgi:hypothetical protein